MPEQSELPQQTINRSVNAKRRAGRCGYGIEGW